MFTGACIFTLNLYKGHIEHDKPRYKGHIETNAYSTRSCEHYDSMKCITFRIHGEYYW